MDKGKINQSTTSSDRIGKALEKYAELMITRMEELQKDWEKGWTDGVHGRGGLPQNISGRSYLGSNAFLLYLHTARHHYAAPVYMTIKQIRDTGATIKKGETSVPVFKWGLSIKDENKKRVSEADYKNMTPEEQEKCKVIPYLQVYNEWNIDQTNLVDVNKEKYDTLLKRFEVLPLKDDTGMYKCAALDRMFERQEWVCPIEYQNINASAYYSVTKDEIVVPRKSQFNIHYNAEDIYKDGMEYYSSALHEMAHSTGHKDRLNRANNTTFGSKEYGKEELVAELTASLVGSSLGFDCRIQENNAAYLKSWISSLREEPKFILTVMSDVNKASKMVIESIDKQRMALGETPLIQGILDVVDEKVKKEEDPKETVAQEWASLDEKPTIKMESGDVLPVEYNKEKDTLDVQITNEDGKQEVYSTNYDHDRNIQENLGHLWEELSNMKQYQAMKLSPEEVAASTEYFTNLMKTLTDGNHEGNSVLDIKSLSELRSVFKNDFNLGRWVSTASDKELIDAGADMLPNLSTKGKNMKQDEKSAKQNTNIDTRQLFDEIKQTLSNFAHEGKDDSLHVLSQYGDVSNFFDKKIGIGLVMPNGMIFDFKYDDQDNKIHVGQTLRNKFEEVYSQDYDKSKTVSENLTDVWHVMSSKKEYNDYSYIKDYTDSIHNTLKITSGEEDYIPSNTVADRLLVRANVKAANYREISQNNCPSEKELYDKLLKEANSAYSDYREELERVVRGYLNSQTISAAVSLPQKEERVSQEYTNMKDYVESITDKNDIMSGNFELLPSDSKVGKLYKDVLHLSKEYDKFTKNPSEYDYEDRAGLYADIESANLSFHAELQKQVESFKKQSQTIHEDSNVKTDVVSKTKEIIATGVPMNDAEKIAKNMVDAELAKKDKERSEEEAEDKKRNEKKYSDEQNKKTEQTVSEEQDNTSPTMRAAAHALLLVGALEAAQKSDGIWMNKGQKQGAEFVNSHTPISAYNNMMMVLHSDKNEYKTNVYTYYNPAKDNNMPVRRSQAALPFSWTTWDYQNVADKTDIISKAEYNKLPEAERSKYKKHASKELQNIYNIDQTTMSSTNKESYASFVKDKGVKLQSLHAESMSFAQYHASQKEKHPDAIILMRTGDFYTTYNEDAKVASNVLGITLTRTSDKTSADGKKILMAGFPNHALDTYLPKLIRAGQRVAICDKVETNPQKVTSEASRIFDHAVEQAKNVSKMTGMKVQRSGLSSTVNYSVADDRFLISSKKLSTISPYEEATDRAAKIYRGLVEAVNKEDRLNISSRTSNLPLAPKEYEKLVVELSAGTIMSRQGLPAKIDKENIDIIPTWTKAIKENPKLVGVIERDVNTTVETIEKLSMNQSVNYAAIRGEAAKSDKADIAIEQHDSYEVKINTFQAIKDDAGHYAFFIKAQDEQSFSVYPQKDHMSTYFNVLKTPERAAVHEALAHKYYELATKYPEMKHDLITPKQVDVDKSLINKVSITSSAQDPKVKLIFVNINGKRDSAVVSPSQWQKMWLADDMASYKRDLAAVLFEQKIRQEMNKGQDNKMEETSSRGFHR